MHNIIKHDTDFYDTESKIYESTRYVVVNKSIIHHIFNKRRSVLGDIFQSLNNKGNVKEILEVACADGVISKEISKHFPKAHIIANDISIKMVESAKLNKLENVDFYIREEEPEQKYDLIIYVGVIGLTDIEKEVEYTYKHLNDGGVFIVSFDSKYAWMNLFGRGKIHGSHRYTILDYEKKFEKYFEVSERFSYGVFIPHLWKLPFANVLQNFVDKIIGIFSRSPHHEHLNVYIKK